MLTLTSDAMKVKISNGLVCTLGVSPSLYQGIVKASDSGVLEDLTFKISEGSDQN